MSDERILADTYIAHITDTMTGETRAVRMHHGFAESSDYWWREGNASCDCNRGLWFQEDVDDDHFVEPSCGDGRYRVRCVDDNGTVLYEDAEQRP